ALDVGVERGVALGGEREEMRGPRLRRRRRLRPPLEDNEGIGAADAERVDPGAPRMTARRPAPKGVVHVEGAAREADGWVWGGEVGGGGTVAVVDGERRLDQAREAGRLLGMADVALDGAHRAVAGARRPALESAGERLDLQRIAGRRARGVALH